MFVKIYAGMWAVFFAALLALFLLGSLTLMAVVIAGFVSFTLVFMGMMCVLPTRVGPHAETDVTEAPKTGPSLTERTRAKVKSLTEPNGIEIRKPHFR